MNDTKLKVLLVEDEVEFAELVKEFLEKHGFEADHQVFGKKAVAQVSKDNYDLVLLDLGLPDIDGLEVCKQIRKNYTGYLIVLSARDHSQDKVSLLNAGADDYLVKPVSLRELLVRIRRFTNKPYLAQYYSTQFSFDDVIFDTIDCKLMVQDKVVELTTKECTVLQYLILKQNQVLSRMDLMDHVWGDDLDVFSNTVNMVISSLRKKLSLVTSKKYIQSVHGVGYRFLLDKNNS